MAQFTDELINKIWEKGSKDPKYNPDFVRKDACGAWIIKGKYLSLIHISEPTRRIPISRMPSSA